MDKPTLRSLVAAAIVVGLLGGVLASPATAQEEQKGIGEKIGARIDRSLRKLSRELREEWAEIRRSVERLGVEGRVYSRLRWDKHLQGAAIEIEVAEGKAVTLRGTVSSATAKQKALELARDTVGVESVVDALTVEPAP